MKHSVFAIALLSSGCARWVFNEKYLECEASLDVQGGSRSMTLHVRPIERNECSIRAEGLFGGNTTADENTVTSDGTLKTTVRYYQGSLDGPSFDSVSVQWSRGAEILIEKLNVGDSQIDGLTILSDERGALDITPDGEFDLSACVGCDVQAVLRGFREVHMTVTDPAVPVQVCVTDVQKLRFVSEGDLDAPHNLAFATGSSAYVQSDAEVVVGEPFEGAVVPESESDPWASATVIGCNPIGFTWGDDQGEASDEE